MRMKILSLIVVLASGMARGQTCANACDSQTQTTHFGTTLPINKWVQYCTAAPVPGLAMSCSQFSNVSDFEACIAQFCPFLPAEISANSTSCGYCLATPVPGEDTTSRVIRCAGASYNAADAFQCYPSQTLQATYGANLNQGDSVVNLTNTGPGLDLLTGLAVDPSSSLCANVYAFAPDEQEISCCSCPVTPDGLASFSVKNDLISNTLTPSVPNSTVIGIIGSISPASGTCNAAAPVGLAPGLAAWGTTLEPASTPGTYGAVNTAFINGNLSASELSSLTQVCGFLQANGTGYGICNGCNLGALGGAKR
jgi:hypothetical protein